MVKNIAALTSVFQTRQSSRVIAVAGVTLFLSLAPMHSYAVAVDVSTVRAAGAMCGAGLSLDVQGDLDARIAKVLGGFGIEGEASLDMGKASDLLSSFSESDRSEAFKTYVSCVIQTVSAMTGVALAANAESDSPEDPNSVSIDNLLLPSALAVIKKNQRFTMAVGDVRAVFSDDLVFSISGFSSSNQSFRYKISDFETGETIGGTAYENDMIVLTNECRMLPYDVGISKGTKSDVNVSFMLRC